MEDYVQKVLSRFKEGFSCSESVLLSFAEKRRIGDKAIPRIAAGFAAGIGGKGSICGALSGAVMALGLAYGRDVVGDVKSYEQCKAASSRCYDEFEKAFGSVFCRDLRGSSCVRYVEKAAGIVLELTEDR